jgi:hypothetical protein
MLRVATSSAASTSLPTERTSALQAGLAVLLFPHALNLLREVIEGVCDWSLASVLNVELCHSLGDGSSGQLCRILLTNVGGRLDLLSSRGLSLRDSLGDPRAGDWHGRNDATAALSTLTSLCLLCGRMRRGEGGSNTRLGVNRWWGSLLGSGRCSWGRTRRLCGDLLLYLLGHAVRLGDLGQSCSLVLCWSLLTMGRTPLALLLRALVVEPGRTRRHVRRKGTGRLVETLAWREPARRRCSERRHAKCTRWSPGKRSRSTGEATRRTKTALIWASWTSWATRAAKRRIATRGKLAMWREVVRWLLLVLLILRSVLTRLRLWYLSQTCQQLHLNVAEYRVVKAKCLRRKATENIHMVLRSRWYKWFTSEKF